MDLPRHIGLLVAVATPLASVTAQNDCIGEKYFFGPEWSASYYGTTDNSREWYFPDWSGGYDVACIPNGNSNTHGIPTIFSKNDCTIGCRRFEFTLKGRNDDGDSIGATLGFCAGDESNPDAEYLAVIWNGSSTQTAEIVGCAGAGTRPAGLHLVRVFGIPDPQEFWSQTNLELPCSDMDSGVELLAEAANRGDTGWPQNTEQTMAIEVLPNRVKVFVNGTLEIDYEGDLSAILRGCFGYYNQSQFADYYRLEVSNLDAVPAESIAYGEGLAGCYGVPVLGTNNAPVLGTDLLITLSNDGPSPASCALLVSPNQTSVFVPFLGGTILVGPDNIGSVPFTVHPGGSTVPCVIRDDACQMGMRLYLQAACMDDCAPFGISLSNGLSLRVGE